MVKVRVICNTSPIIGLLTIKRLELLEKLFDEIYIPEAVYRELCINAENIAMKLRRFVKKWNQAFLWYIRSKMQMW